LQLEHGGTSEEPDLQLFLSGEEDEEVLQALRECPDAAQVMEEAQWIVALIGWRVDTHQRQLPTALVASIEEQDRRRVRYLRQIEGHRFRVTITAGWEVIVSLRHNHAEKRGGGVSGCVKHTLHISRLLFFPPRRHTIGYYGTMAIYL